MMDSNLDDHFCTLNVGRAKKSCPKAERHQTIKYVRGVIQNKQLLIQQNSWHGYFTTRAWEPNISLLLKHMLCLIS